MLADVPLGAFLSGGIDSSTVVAIMQSQSASPVKTFTIGFNNDDYSEAKHAKKIADYLRTDHTEIYISPKQALEVIPKLPSIYDEPFSDSSQIPTFLVSQLAKQHVKVSLSGDGGDELFCGYNRHLMSKKFEKVINSIPPSLRKFFSLLIKSISPDNWTRISKFLPILNRYNNFGDKIYKGANVLETSSFHEMYLKLCSNWQDPREVVIGSKEPDTILNKFKSDLEGLNGQEKMMIMDMLTYLTDDILVKVDRASMANSLETRAPFLDHKLIEYVWKIPHSLKYKSGEGKWILKKILGTYIPENLTNRPKMGFGVPIDSWLEKI